MKFRIQFKDPDGVYDSLRDAVDASIHRSLETLDSDPSDFSDDEIGVAKEARLEKYQQFISAWVLYSEYITIEFDTETGTAVVVKNA